MKKAFPVLLIYLACLLVFYFLFRWLEIADWEYLIADKIPLTALFIVAAIGGIIALRFTVSPASFRIFLIVYSALWMLRLLFLYLGTTMMPVHLGSKAFDIPAILTNYFTFVFRLDTPLPFMFFWLIDYLFVKQKKNIEDLQKHE
jgi:hypothetical protein